MLPKVFKNFMNSTPLILLDGAMGTELQRRGVRTSLPLWSAEAVSRAPATVREIHVEYITAGANIITTNTFRTNRRTLDKVGRKNESQSWTSMAVALAVQARDAMAKSRHVFVAGSMAPVEDCYRPDLVPGDAELIDEHNEFALVLKKAGVDIILCETMNTIREALIALRAAADSGLPALVSLIVNEHGDLMSGESLQDAVKVLEPIGPAAIMLNCATCDVMGKYVPALRDMTTLPIGVYAHVGQPDETAGWKPDPYATAENYLTHAKVWVQNRAKIIGGCCGTTPKFIRLMDKTFRKFTHH